MPEFVVFCVINRNGWFPVSWSGRYRIPSDFNSLDFSKEMIARDGFEPSIYGL